MYLIGIRKLLILLIIIDMKITIGNEIIIFGWMRREEEIRGQLPCHYQPIGCRCMACH